MREYNFKRFDFDRLALLPHAAQRAEFTQSEIQKMQYLPLSEALINRHRGGTQVMIEIARMAEEGLPDANGNVVDSDRYQFELEVLCDKWGTRPKKGDVIKWKRQINYKDNGATGKAMSHKQISEKLRTQAPNTPNKWHVEGQAVVDGNGRIKVRFSDAEMLLNLHGKFWLNNTPISKKRDINTHPQRNPENDKMMKVHNWRFVEVPRPVAQILKDEKQNKKKPEQTNITN